MSAAIITQRRLIRSTQTPAGSPTMRNAAVDAAARSATSNVVACSVRTARSGMARTLT